MNNIKTRILNNYIKSTSALTIVEVLVAIILTAIVMLHGTVFFVTTWRLSSESKEYNMILNDVVANLEKCNSRKFDLTAVMSDSYVVRNKKLRDKYDVRYTMIKDISPYALYGFYYIVSSARWRYGGDAKSDNIISIKTACAERWPC